MDIPVSIDKVKITDIKQIFNLLKIDYNENIFDFVINEKTNNNFIYLSDDYIDFYNSNVNENDIIYENTIIKPNPKLYINNTILKFENNILIGSSWYNTFLDIFKYVFKKVLPKIFLDISQNILNENIFQFTFYNKPNEIKAIIITHQIGKHIACASIDPNSKFLKQLHEKLNKQTGKYDSYIDWFSKGNFYSNNILLLNLALTYNSKNESQFNIWKTFIKNLLNSIFLLNPSIPIYTIGKDAKSFISLFTFNNRSNIYIDVDPNIKTKPSNYLESPSFFNDYSHLF